VNPNVLLALAEQHLMLTRPTARAHPDDIRRNHGKFGYSRNLLRDFVQFWSTKGCVWPIPSALVFDWVSEGANPKQPYRDPHRLFVVCGFLKHLRTTEPATEVPPNIFRKPPRRNPRLLSNQEVVELMEATKRLRACPASRRLTLVTMLGLLACTGLRIGEALRLNMDEAYLDADPPHLAIHDTKFGKSRIVVLHPTAAERLREYVRQRMVTFGSRSAETFFTCRTGKPLSYNVTRGTFRRLVRHAGITSETGERNVTLHSLRHGFAVNRLTLWHQAGKNVSELLPHLTVYLGHLDPRDTYWYLSATTELLGAASARFEINHQAGDRQP
jgi:integrase/recombinase XerD